MCPPPSPRGSPMSKVSIVSMSNTFISAGGVSARGYSQLNHKVIRMAKTPAPLERKP